MLTLISHPPVVAHARSVHALPREAVLVAGLRGPGGLGQEAHHKVKHKKRSQVCPHPVPGTPRSIRGPVTSIHHEEHLKRRGLVCRAPSAVHSCVVCDHHSLTVSLFTSPCHPPFKALQTVTDHAPYRTVRAFKSSEPKATHNLTQLLSREQRFARFSLHKEVWCSGPSPPVCVPTTLDLSGTSRRAG